jgi:CheY-like chemotaxis protein
MTVTTPSGARVDVLIVDDSDDQLTLLRENFERAGCTVTAVANAEAAMQAWAASRPDLAVIDLILPGMDGWALATKLHAELPDCALAITSVLDIVDFPVADAILPKPFTGAQVRQLLGDCVPKWRAR